jgi:hypothetical protein
MRFVSGALRAAREHAALVAVFIAIVIAVFSASPLHLPLNNPNEGVRVFAVKALVEHRTLAIDEVVRAWGYIDDKAAREGRLYSSKAPLMSLLGAAAYAPVHAVAGMAGEELSRASLTRLCRASAGALPALVTALLLWRGLRRRVKERALADLVLVGTVLGSGVLASMNVFSGHALAALAPAAALVLGLPEPGGQPRPRWHLPAAGLLLAAAVGAEYPALLAALPVVGVTLFFEGSRAGARGALRGLLALAAGALPIVIVVAIAHTAMFGAPWRTGYSFLENQGYREVVAGTLFGIGAPKLDVLGSVLVSPELGLFFGSPMLLVGAAFALWQLGRREERVLGLGVVLGCAFMLLFIAGFRGWRGGWSVGPRYISELIGLLAVPTALAFDRLAQIGARSRVAAHAALAGLVAVGLLHSGVAGAFYPHLSDVYRNPVYEMLLPLVARGFSPDSVFLWLGLPPAVSAALLLVVLTLPLLVLFLSLPGAKPRACMAGAAAASVALSFAIGPSLAHSDGARAALETRRLIDNWRPEGGVPLLRAARRDAGPSGALDVPVLFAVGRAGEGWRRALAEGCEKRDDDSAARGRLAPLARRLARGDLVVVPDQLALDLYDVAGAGPVFVTRADVERHAKSGVPCGGRVYVLVSSRGASREQVPRALARFTVKQTTPLDDDTALGGAGFELRELEAPAR